MKILIAFSEICYYNCINYENGIENKGFITSMGLFQNKDNWDMKMSETFKVHH